MSQSTIKMDKGYYAVARIVRPGAILVAIHNKNGKGLLQKKIADLDRHIQVAIHNKNGKGLLQQVTQKSPPQIWRRNPQ